MSAPTKNIKVNSVLNKSFQNLSNFFILSLITKVIALGCNILLARFISKEAYGITKIYFEFAFTLICFFPKETIRKTAQKFCPDKSPSKEDYKYYLACKLYFIIFILMIIFTLFMFIAFVVFSNENVKNNSIQLIIFMICGLCELLVEPVIVYMNLKIENKRIGFSISALFRVVSNLLFAVLFKFDLWSFTIGRIIGTIGYVGYFGYFAFVKYKLKVNEMIPKWNELFSQDKKTDEKDVDVVKEVLGSFVKSTLLKMVIQNCEKVILSFVLDNTNEEKGEYSFVIDKFGLINGILLEPVEENFYNVINKIKNYDNNDKDKDKGNSERSLNILKLFVKAMLLFGTFLVGYMFLIGKEIFEIVFSSKWASLSTIKIAKIYSIYVAIISVNGIVESYASATNNTQQMNQTNILMISNSCMLMVLSFLLSKVDICGLIYANAISMVIRIFGNLYIIFWSKQSEKQERKWKGINTFINEYYLSYGSIIGTVSCLSFGWFVKEGVLSGKGNFVKICACGMIGVINLGLVILFEKNRIKNEIQKIKRD